jgi:catechol 2,3-dioxygenase-like lactoylglutathione lyase family enzyme
MSDTAKTNAIEPNALQSSVIQVTPFMHVENLERSLAFFTDILGFEVTVRMSNYAYMRLGTAAIRILEYEKEHRPPPGDRRYAYYVDVRDVDALYAALKPKLDTLPNGDVHGPVDQSYGQRELVVLVPDGNLLAFGQTIRA